MLYNKGEKEMLMRTEAKREKSDAEFACFGIN